MATKQAYKRLTKEYISIQSSPPPYIIARPSESNILEWHYVITGPQDSPYANGQYWGTLVFPSEYPYKPPSIKMLTPNGRFATNERLCLSMSDFHPGSWNPSWSVSTILTGLLSFMLEDTPTTGSITTTKDDKILLAAQSRLWNARNNKFRDLFPELAASMLSHPAALVAAGNVRRSQDLDSNNDGAGLFGTGLFRQRRLVPANAGNGVVNNVVNNVNNNMNQQAAAQQQQQQQQQSEWRFWGQFIWNLVRIFAVVIFAYVLMIKIMVAWGWL